MLLEDLPGGGEGYIGPEAVVVTGNGELFCYEDAVVFERDDTTVRVYVRRGANGLDVHVPAAAWNFISVTATPSVLHVKPANVVGIR